jgi:hypothetical protein
MLLKSYETHNLCIVLSCQSRQKVLRSFEQSSIERLNERNGKQFLGFVCEFPKRGPVHTPTPRPEEGGGRVRLSRAFEWDPISHGRPEIWRAGPSISRWDPDSWNWVPRVVAQAAGRLWGRLQGYVGSAAVYELCGLTPSVCRLSRYRG